MTATGIFIVAVGEKLIRWQPRTMKSVGRAPFHMEYSRQVIDRSRLAQERSAQSSMLDATVPVCKWTGSVQDLAKAAA